MKNLASDARVIAIEDQSEEIAFLVKRLLEQITAWEVEARPAQPQPPLVFGWARFSLDTGLTADQERFVSQWSPQSVLDQCSAQRTMIHLLNRWLSRHDDADSYELALALVSAFTEARRTTTLP